MLVEKINNIGGISITSQLFIVPNILSGGITTAQQYIGLGLSAFIPAILIHGGGNFLLAMAEAFNLIN